MNDKKLQSVIKKAKASGAQKELAEKLAGRGAGVLLFRGTPAGNGVWYFKYTREGRRIYTKFGQYPSTTLREARIRADELSALHLSGTDVKQHLATEDGDPVTATFGDLLERYRDSLEGRTAYVTVKSLFKIHVFERWPEMVKLPARDITPHQCLQIARASNQSGIEAGCNILIAYLKAAFNSALQAEFAIKGAVVRFGIQSNPAQHIKQVREWVRANDEYATIEQLRQLFDSCNNQAPAKPTKKDSRPMGAVHAAMVQLLCLTGQRPEQVIRLKWSDYDETRHTLKMFNGKGRSMKEHVIPVTGLMAGIFDTLKEFRTSDGEYIFSLNGGGKPASMSHLSGRFKQHTNYHGIEVQKLKLIRSGWSTGCADARLNIIGRELVQSHVVGSKVGAVHYDKSQHLDAKREVIEGWETYLLNPCKDDMRAA
ncbi:tyrosine-type recombinase/integrase [Sansalvadorimonas verongulae]|uniref:tyrosine-type recombinase/integrase n=1 Tax=Sansalvadorimonas verongulae TaxID=2172824 RepID=UPI0012BBC951|nr:integrase family protein [Sansalvadorimonas verongulae]MTI13242.1 DUF4102 domain-containing protein [Sansalvadorimonas verongulae]